ncbi:YciI family protein [Pelagibacterium halotolerans]|uniref:YciI family protein n=1 Tax=Pelagibacterium halotolerans TaxID=531813 RepID=UPI00384D3745
MFKPANTQREKSVTQKTYLCIQRSPQRPHTPTEAPSPGKMEEMYARFTAWREKFKDNIVDLGGKLGGAAMVVTADGTKDGPFVEAKELVGGYMLIAAETIEQAAEIAQQSPGTAGPGYSVEVREIVTP